MQEIFLQTTTLGKGTLLFTSDKFQIALKDQHMYLISKRYNFLVSLCPSKQSLYLCMLCKDSIKFTVSIFVEQLELRQQELE